MIVFRINIVPLHRIKELTTYKGLKQNETSTFSISYVFDGRCELRP